MSCEWNKTFNIITHHVQSPPSSVINNLYCIKVLQSHLNEGHVGKVGGYYSLSKHLGRPIQWHACAAWSTFTVGLAVTQIF